MSQLNGFGRREFQHRLSVLKSCSSGGCRRKVKQVRSKGLTITNQFPCIEQLDEFPMERFIIVKLAPIRSRPGELR